MGFLESALALAAKGFHVFPIAPNRKAPPLIVDFPNKATRHPEIITKWWKLYPNANIGISTSRFGDNEALVVVDVDNKDGKNGNEEVVKLEIEGKEFPKTFTQKTPAGGHHYVYRANAPTKQGVNVFGPGIDVRSAGGYIVGSGSVVKKGVYQHEEFDILDRPEWFMEVLRESNPITHSPNRHVGVNVNSETANSRAVHYLEHEAPIAVENQGGDQTTFQVACKVKDFGVSKDRCIGLMLDHWNDRCTPPWSEAELTAKVQNAYRYGVEPIGIASPEADFKVDSKIENGEDEKNRGYLEKINKRYALVYIEGSHFILDETIDESGRKKRVFLTEQTFKRRYSTHLVEFANGKRKTQADIWLNWPGRREYSGLCFKPELEARNGYYNMWRGFGTTPTPYELASVDARKGFDMFMEHAFKNVCGSDQNLFDWLIGYFAQLIQKPYERPLTTLVFRGTKGVGKNALIDRFGKILGQGHYLVAHNSRYLTSNFNGYLDSCLCLVLDEAFWSGDKAAEGILKGLTTAPEIFIERKNKEPYTVDNLVRLVVIGNEDWLVPASNDERRYAVYDVGTGRMQDRKFFEEMRILMDDKGGNNILHHHLKNFDLSKIDVNGAPNTKGLMDQKLSSLNKFHTFWFECLSQGRIIESDFGETWPVETDKEVLRIAFSRYMKSRQISGWAPDNRVIGKLLKQSMPLIKTKQKRIEEQRSRHYLFPDLLECRRQWEIFIGHSIDWDETN